MDQETSGNRSKLPIILITIFILLSVLGGGFFLYAKQQGSKNILGAKLGPKEVESVISRVSKLIELPTDEVPTVATVSDKSKLPNQPFFKNAQNGDTVLIFQKAKKAILYRSTINKIIEVSYLNIQAPVPAAQGAASPSSTTSIPTGSVQPTVQPTKALKPTLIQ